MIGNRLRWSATLGFLLVAAFTGGCAAPQKTTWRPGTSSPAPVAVANQDARIGRPVPVAARDYLPGAVLHRPVPIPDQTAVISAPAPAIPVPVEASPVAPVGYQEPGFLVRAQAPDGVYQSLYQPPSPPPPTGELPTPPNNAPPGAYIPDPQIHRPLTQPNGFWDKCHQWFGGSGTYGSNDWFISDHRCDGMISPVSNPFFLEDPRALTELRPLFLFNTSSRQAPVIAGGNSYFLGLQGRVAFNDRWSLVINKLGIVSYHPKDPLGDFTSSTGLAEINIGPKFTFLNNTSTNTVAAFGANFQLPLGSTKAQQNNGTLGIDPYFTIGQTFGRTSYGQFDFIGTVGYDISVDNKRAEFFHTGLHLDFDIASAHKWYPLLELNWFHYSQAGTAQDLRGLQGLDLGNFGSVGVAQKDFWDIALGFRYKFNEHVQFGTAFEFPLSRPRDIQDFRLTLDMIFRY